MSSLYTVFLILGVAFASPSNSTTDQPDALVKRAPRHLHQAGPGNPGQVHVIGTVQDPQSVQAFAPPPPPPPMGMPTIECYHNQYGSVLDKFSCTGACTYKTFPGNIQRSTCVQYEGLDPTTKYYKQSGAPRCVANTIPHGSAGIESMCYCFEDYCNTVKWLSDHNCFVGLGTGNGVSTLNCMYIMVFFIVTLVF